MEIFLLLLFGRHIRGHGRNLFLTRGSIQTRTLSTHLKIITRSRCSKDPKQRKLVYGKSNCFSSYYIIRISEIFKLLEWISVAVYNSLQNNFHLKRGDIPQLKFISLALEIISNGSHPVFEFIKLQRSDIVVFNKVKVVARELNSSGHNAQ